MLLYSNIDIPCYSIAGEVGGWKHWFTTEMLAEFDAWWTTGTKDLDLNLFKFKYEL